QESVPLQILSAEFTFDEQSTIDLTSGGATAFEAWEEVGRPASAQLENPILATVLLKLLSSAHRALATERDQADKFIAQATALVSAEVQRRKTGERCPSSAFARR